MIELFGNSVPTPLADKSRGYQRQPETQLSASRTGIGFGLEIGLVYSAAPM